MEKREEKLLRLADIILEKLTRRVEAAEGESLNPQALKHITGVMKDLRELQQDARDTGEITVTFSGEWEPYNG